jgi:predicted DNA-binding transcriptional regulator AlpA
MSEQQSVAMTEHEVARRLRISAATLRAWRVRRKGPRYVRFGRAVRYLSADIDRFIQTSLVDAADAPGRDPSATRSGSVQ